ncbi:MAG: hypothetical protein P1V97_01810 [Planctomycetota bacterium]|nr:hypothetical protein [Planctomycetota bacterium]
MSDLEYCTSLIVGIRFSNTYSLWDKPAQIITELFDRELFTDGKVESWKAIRLRNDKTGMKILVSHSDIVIEHPYENFRTMSEGSDRDRIEESSVPYEEAFKVFMDTVLEILRITLPLVRPKYLVRFGVLHNIRLPNETIENALECGIGDKLSLTENVKELRLVTSTLRSGEDEDNTPEEYFNTIITVTPSNIEDCRILGIDRQKCFRLNYLRFRPRKLNEYFIPLVREFCKSSSAFANTFSLKDWAAE